MLYRIGPNETLKSIRDIKTLVPGDTVEVLPGIYYDARQWPNAGTIESPIKVKSVEKHKAIFDGRNFSFAGTPRAGFEVLDGHYDFDGFKFRNINNGGLNASAIRCVKGSIAVSNCHIRNCGMGIQTTAPILVLLKFNDIGWCGFGNNSHNIYLSGGTKSIVEDNIFQQTAGGINVKIRTRYAEVRRNKIYDSIDGEVQFCDGPETITDGADAILEDNEIRTLANRGRGNKQRVIAFGHEGKLGTDRIGALIMRRNKIILQNKDQILVSLDSPSAKFFANDNFIDGVSNNLLRIRYGAHAGISAPLNYMRGLAFQGFPEVWTPPSAPPPPDTIPPAKPRNVEATQTDKTITLTWEPGGNDTDIAYYEIDAQWGPYSMGNECEYVQTAGLYPGRTYEYRVIAVDHAGNRSPASDLVSIIKE